MKDVVFINLEEELENNHDITQFLSQVLVMMKKEYPKYEEWFKNKVIPGLNKKERNIIVVTKKNKVIGFINLKKTAKEKKMSNLYINSTFNYEKICDKLFKISLNWLNTTHPTIIISSKELVKCMDIMMKNNWSYTRHINNEYIFNGNNNEFVNIEKKLTLKNNSKNRINNK